MNNKYYTYAYLREDGTPYYIGKGEGNRAYKKQHNCPVPKDRNRIIFLKQNLCEEEALRHETYLIAVLGRKDLGTGILRNLTDGGEGVSGVVWTEERRKSFSEYKKKNPSIMSDEYIERLRRRMKNFSHTDEAKDKISRANSGRKWDEDSRKRGSIAQKERYKKGNNSLANLTPEKRKEIVQKSNETNKKNGTGAWGLSEEERRERAKKNYHKTLGVVNSTMWKCLVTGKITNAGALTGYQKARGIDISLREKIV
jgi:hypothetical protein